MLGLPHRLNLCSSSVPVPQRSAVLDFLHEVFLEPVEEVLICDADSGAGGDGRVGVPGTNIDVPIKRVSKISSKKLCKHVETHDGLYINISKLARSSAVSAIISTKGTSSYSPPGAASADRFAKTGELCRRTGV